MESISTIYFWWNIALKVVLVQMKSRERSELRHRRRQRTDKVVRSDIESRQMRELADARIKRTGQHQLKQREFSYEARQITLNSALPRSATAI